MDSVHIAAIAPLLARSEIFWLNYPSDIDLELVRTLFALVPFLAAEINGTENHCR
jgi:hypothetical protein